MPLRCAVSYDRFRRTGIKQVEVELMLTLLGFNIRKFLRFMSSGKRPAYWKAPEGTMAQTFKKPSAKRITKRVMNHRKKSKNEMVRDSYKYKK